MLYLIRGRLHQLRLMFERQEQANFPSTSIPWFIACPMDSTPLDQKQAPPCFLSTGLKKGLVSRAGTNTHTISIGGCEGAFAHGGERSDAPVYFLNPSSNNKTPFFHNTEKDIIDYINFAIESDSKTRRWRDGERQHPSLLASSLRRDSKVRLAPEPRSGFQQSLFFTLTQTWMEWIAWCGTSGPYCKHHLIEHSHATDQPGISGVFF